MRIEKIFMLLILVSLIASCSGQSAKTDKLGAQQVTDTSKSNKLNDSLSKRKAIDAQMAQGDRPDSEEETPSPMEERKRIANSYDNMRRIDTTLIRGNDSLHFHLKYYCLKNSTLTIPKSYNKAQDDFVTHPFASNIMLINGKDTVLNKQFQATDFNPFFTDNFGGNLKKYGSILMPTLSRKNKDGNQIVLAYSIAIPATDIGKGMFLIISKKGEYKIAEHY